MASSYSRTSIRKNEWLSFLVFTLIILPAIGVAFVGSYGFVVWMKHEIYGPPTVKYETAAPAVEETGPGTQSAPPADGVN